MEALIGPSKRVLESSCRDIKLTLQLAWDVKAIVPWAAAIHLPFYLWIELLFYYLNPSDPPLSIKNAIATVLSSSIIAFLLVLVASAVSFHAIIEHATSRCSLSNAAPNFSTERRSLSIKRIFYFLTIVALGLLFVITFMAWQLLIANRSMLVVPVALCTPFMLSALLVTIPCIIIENCSAFSGVIRSFKLSLQSWDAVVATILSIITINAIWIIPLTVSYPRNSTFGSIIVMCILWMATSWNILLPVAIWRRLLRGIIPMSGDNVSVSKDGQSIPTDHQHEPSKKGLSWRFAAILLLLVGMGWMSLRQFHGLLSSMEEPSSGQIIYNPARADWSGAQCLEMLLHDALAFHRNVTYGGACVEKETHRHVETRSLLQNLSSLGVNKFLKFACPPKGLADPSITWRFLPWILGNWIVTEEWTAYLRSRINYPSTPNDVFKIVCHIRRDDIKPCTGDKVHKYLPNSYYLDMIGKYRSLASAPEHRHKTVEVVIHSQDRSWESLDIFRQLNYTLKLGNTPLQDVWMEMITADVFIMSQSGFSVVPALMNRDGVVVFAPYLFFEKAPSWTSVDHRTLRRYKKEVWELRQTCGAALKRHREGRSGVMFLLRTIGKKESIRFFNPN
jgi:hypothetical protein